MNTVSHHRNPEIPPMVDRLIDDLRDLGALRTTLVEAALRAVPRHRFAPEFDPADAYHVERALVTKRDERGVSVSSVSAARIQTFMAEQAALAPGMSVLEIGSGGYNAALLAELVGPAGRVVSIDIDADVIARARRLLDEMGYGRVVTRVADGLLGAGDLGPFDRIVVTVETPDLAPAWLDQLSPSGRLVAPLRLRGLTRSIAFDRDAAGPGEVLAGVEHEVCGFVPMRGTGAREVDLVVLHDDTTDDTRTAADIASVGLRLDSTVVDVAPASPDLDGLRLAVVGHRQESWSGVTLAVGTAYDDLDLWLAGACPDYALLASTRAARDTGIVASWSPLGVSTLLDPTTSSFAYVAMRPANESGEAWELGAAGHGSDAARLAEALCDHIRAWSAHPGAGPRFHARPFDSAVPVGEVVLLRGRAVAVSISWPVD